jgi:hypothetical protein
MDLDFQLASGVKLRDATRSQVEAQVQIYDLRSRDMRHKAKWLGLVAQSVPDGAIVGDIIDEAHANELFAVTAD